MSQDETADPSMDAGAVNRARDEVIVLAREMLRVDRRTVDRGGVRVHVSVQERDETFNVLLHEQEVEVERVAVGRPVESAPEARQEGDVFIVPIVEEVLVVERRLVLKEELRIRRTDRRRPARETVRLRSEVASIEAVPPQEG